MISEYRILAESDDLAVECLVVATYTYEENPGDKEAACYQNEDDGYYIEDIAYEEIVVTNKQTGMSHAALEIPAGLFAVAEEEAHKQFEAAE